MHRLLAPSLASLAVSSLLLAASVAPLDAAGKQSATNPRAKTSRFAGNPNFSKCPYRAGIDARDYVDIDDATAEGLNGQTATFRGTPHVWGTGPVMSGGLSPGGRSAWYTGVVAEFTASFPRVVTAGEPFDVNVRARYRHVSSKTIRANARCYRWAKKNKWLKSPAWKRKQFILHLRQGLEIERWGASHPVRANPMKLMFQITGEVSSDGVGRQQILGSLQSDARTSQSGGFLSMQFNKLGRKWKTRKFTVLPHCDPTDGAFFTSGEFGSQYTILANAGRLAANTCGQLSVSGRAYGELQVFFNGKWRTHGSQCVRNKKVVGRLTDIFYGDRAYCSDRGDDADSDFRVDGPGFGKCCEAAYGQEPAIYVTTAP